jgi:hypothetical protein
MGKCNGGFLSIRVIEYDGKFFESGSQGKGAREAGMDNPCSGKAVVGLVFQRCSCAGSVAEPNDGQVDYYMTRAEGSWESRMSTLGEEGAQVACDINEQR